MALMELLVLKTYTLAWLGLAWLDPLKGENWEEKIRN